MQSRSRRAATTCAARSATSCSRTRLSSDDASESLLKFHGIYQQDDRDRRKEARKLGRDKHHQMMIRTRIPGGVVSPGGVPRPRPHRGGVGQRNTLRVTTRQDFQVHGVLKGDFKSAIRAINDGLLTTLGGCGDQERNIMCCPAPWSDRVARGDPSHARRTGHRADADARAPINEIWLDGELAASNQPDPPDTLYGDRYLPRKFKTAIAIAGDNCVDIYANDLGLVAHAHRTTASLAGFDLLVGGGLGRTQTSRTPGPRSPQPLGYVQPEHVVEAARAVVAVQRDYGDRTDRRHARLKYLIARPRALSGSETRSRHGVTFDLEPSRPLRWNSVDDHLGWHEQGDGRALPTGCSSRTGGSTTTSMKLSRSALREVAETLRLPAALDTAAERALHRRRRSEPDDADADHGSLGSRRSEEVPSTIRHSMACPAYPTCGLAVAESERALPSLIREIALIQRDAGGRGPRISYRMAGCPNGCSRPYLGDVGFVGTTLGKYDVFLGGDIEGTRLNELYMHNVKLEDIPDLLRGPLL